MRCTSLSCLAMLSLALPAAAETTLRVMSFNAWGGGANEGKGVEETVAAIRAAGADIVGLQETRLEPEICSATDCSATDCAATGDSVAPAIAAALGWHVYDQSQQNVALWALLDAGFVDAYRTVYPDPVAKPALTWSPRSDEAATDDHPVRIDFVVARGPGLVVTKAAIVGEDGPRSDIVVIPWPSDHRAVLAEVRF